MGIRGRLRTHVPLAPMTWLRVGGMADMVFTPADEKDLALFLQRNERPISLVMGAGSNLLIRDGGVPGVVIKLGRGFYDFSIEGNEIEIGSGMLDRVVAERCQAAGLSGFEFLYTIPGTIGGSLRMNSGCYGGEMADRLIWAWAMDSQGRKHKLWPQDLGYGYRTCDLPEGWIFLGGRFHATPSDPQTVGRTMAYFAKQREETQPSQVRTGGSTFANPPGYKAWELIDRAGYRGRFRGQAQFSSKHCNFLINHGKACSADLEELGEEARQKVFELTGIQLKWEIVRLGRP